MTFQPESLTAASEIATPPDVLDVLRGLAKSVRGTRKAIDAYPRQGELVAMLADARVRIDRINATAA
jgi:hypothetical protein